MIIPGVASSGGDRTGSAPPNYFWIRHYRQLPRAYKTVSVNGGEVKFVDIDDGLFGTKKTSGFRITTWSLKWTDLKWVKDTVLPGR